MCMCVHMHEHVQNKYDRNAGVYYIALKNCLVK